MQVNESAIKRYALVMSKERRAGKFKRVGESFMARVRRKIEAAFPNPSTPNLSSKFLTPESRERILETAEHKIATIVEQEVQSHPSVGKTLL